MDFYDITPILPAFIEKVNKEKDALPKPIFIGFYFGDEFT